MSARPPLRLTFASPCSKDWSQMKGSAQKRFCEGCQQNVYDLSAMRYDEAKALIEQERPPCVRLYQRADGTVMTADCPVGRERKWRQLKRVLRCAAAACVAWAAVAFTQSRRKMGCGGGPDPSPPDAAAWHMKLANIPPPVETPPDESWMAERRARVSSRERLLQRTQRTRVMMGVIRGVNVAEKK